MMFNIEKIKEILKNGSLKLERKGLSEFIEKEIKLPNMSIYEFFVKRSKMNACEEISICHEDVLTMDRLKEEVEVYAKSFLAMGVKKGDVVPLCLQTNNESIIAFFALNKIGAISTFLNATANKDEIELYLKKYNAKHFMISSKFTEELEEIINNCNLDKTVVISPKDTYPNTLNLSELTEDYIKLSHKDIKETNKIISLDTFKKIGQNYHGTTECLSNAKDPAFICYTSGTTGEPKAIVLSNENIIFEMLSLKQTTHMQLGTKGKSLQVVPFNYPYGFLISTLFPMYVGKTAALTPMLTLKTIGEYMEMYKPTYIQAIPSFYSNLQTNGKTQNMDLSFLKYPVSGGDKMDLVSKKNINEFFKEHGSKAKICDGSGNGEGCGCLTTSVVLGQYNPSSVGKPIKGLSVKAIGSDGKPVKLGEVGKFCFSGQNVMMEYYGDKEATNAVKKIDKNGREWFYTDTHITMDKAKWQYFQGRDRRFFITYNEDGSPYKVYCDHVQEIIKSCEGIFDCAVVQKPDENRCLVPKAFIILRDGFVLDSDLQIKIIAICKSKLQNCAIPTEIEVLDQLPLTRANKMDYTVLEKIAYSEYELEKSKVKIKGFELK